MLVTYLDRLRHASNWLEHVPLRVVTAFVFRRLVSQRELRCLYGDTVLLHTCPRPHDDKPPYLPTNAPVEEQDSPVRKQFVRWRQRRRKSDKSPTQAGRVSTGQVDVNYHLLLLHQLVHVRLLCVRQQLPVGRGARMVIDDVTSARVQQQLFESVHIRPHEHERPQRVSMCVCAPARVCVCVCVCKYVLERKCIYYKRLGILAAMYGNKTHARSHAHPQAHANAQSQSSTHANVHSSTSQHDAFTLNVAKSICFHNWFSEEHSYKAARSHNIAGNYTLSDYPYNVCTQYANRYIA